VIGSEIKQNAHVGEPEMTNVSRGSGQPKIIKQRNQGQREQPDKSSVIGAADRNGYTTTDCTTRPVWIELTGRSRNNYEACSSGGVAMQPEVVKRAGDARDGELQSFVP
jgi:hypothetical protein